jgi:hypothetical protein
MNKEDRIEQLREQKCATDRCYNYHQRDNLFCIHCLPNSPIELSKEEIKLLKEDDLISDKGVLK